VAFLFLLFLEKFMIFVYINYPNPHFEIHKQGCGQIQMHQRENQRFYQLDSIKEMQLFLDKLIHRKFRFAAQAGLNDMWIEINLGDEKLNESLVYVIRAIIGQRYTPLANALIESHDC
jgi:hypothetical protein